MSSKNERHQHLSDHGLLGKPYDLEEQISEVKRLLKKSDEHAAKAAVFQKEITRLKRTEATK
ncbi:hypothetical protein [Pseudohongiella acticola]|uniref:hypothetical protein n=1 Tax=Pseudohongiella acticola TaxID=1524254 RepID=UPI0030EC6AA8